MTISDQSSVARRVSRSRASRRVGKRVSQPLPRPVIRASRYPVCDELGMLALVAVVTPML